MTSLSRAAATLAIAVAAMADTAPAWAVNKCTGPDGAVTYQEAACGTSAKAKSVKVPSGPAPNKWDQMVSDALAKARVHCKTNDIPYYPEVGWSEERFIRCSRAGVLGASAVNETSNAGGVSKQYVFRLVNSYVYTQNGVVTSIQKSR